MASPPAEQPLATCVSECEALALDQRVEVGIHDTPAAEVHPLAVGRRRERVAREGAAVAVSHVHLSPIMETGVDL